MENEDTVMKVMVIVKISKKLEWCPDNRKVSVHVMYYIS